MSKRDEVMRKLLDGIADKISFDPEGSKHLADAYSLLWNVRDREPDSGIALASRDKEST